MKRIPASFVPLIAFDYRAKTPMYRQLYNWFRRAIIDGQMRPGQRVPSTRGLAAELKISRIPILNAYDQLLAEGYFETFVGAGTCVAGSIPDDTQSPPAVKVRKGLEEIVEKPGPRRMSRRGVALTDMPAQSWLDNLGAFRVSLPALDRFPIGVWSKLVARHSRRPPRGIMAYGDAMGYLPFREAIAEYLGAVRAVRCEPSQILVTTGSQQGLQISAQVLLDPKDRVWMERTGLSRGAPGFCDGRSSLDTGSGRSRGHKYSGAHPARSQTACCLYHAIAPIPHGHDDERRTPYASPQLGSALRCLDH